MLETAAAYWESIVRIYGITEKVDLTMTRLVFPVARLAYWAGKIVKMTDTAHIFELVLTQELASDRHQICLVYNEETEYFQKFLAEQRAAAETNTSCRRQAPVELISFHGPHFQDRFGIAHSVFGTLEKNNIPLLAAGCTGTSVNLVFPEKLGRTAVLALADSFVVPQTENSRKHPSIENG
jgi:aspartokinase